MFETMILTIPLTNYKTHQHAIAALFGIGIPLIYIQENTATVGYQEKVTFRFKLLKRSVKLFLKLTDSVHFVHTRTGTLNSTQIITKTSAMGNWTIITIAGPYDTEAAKTIKAVFPDLILDQVNKPIMLSSNKALDCLSLLKHIACSTPVGTWALPKGTRIQNIF